MGILPIESSNQLQFKGEPENEKLPVDVLPGERPDIGGLGWAILE